MPSPNSNGTGPTFYSTTLVCDQDRATANEYFIPEGRNAKVQIEVPTGDDAGTFYVRSKARKAATAVRHTVLFASKAAASALNAVLDYNDGSGWIDIEYDSDSGSDAVTATITILVY